LTQMRAAGEVDDLEVFWPVMERLAELFPDGAAFTAKQAQLADGLPMLLADPEIIAVMGKRSLGYAFRDILTDVTLGNGLRLERVMDADGQSKRTKTGVAFKVAGTLVK